jgi:hypothetical protein
MRTPEPEPRLPEPDPDPAEAEPKYPSTIPEPGPDVINPATPGFLPGVALHFFASPSVFAHGRVTAVRQLH